ncbi:hypothetical protein ABZY09_39410 [Streptomyces sp. NPDC002928]|uniref:sodium:solute symporter family transporter n=1 Tax=Streptomyces sp. NPDC002928 TaxID=3154440 RepID=UPI0033A24C5E
MKPHVTLGVMLTVALSMLNRFHWDLDALLHAASTACGQPANSYLSPGREFGSSVDGRLDFLGVQLTVVFSACMPHMIMRVNCAPHGAAARRAARHGIYTVAALMLGVVLLGVSAAATVGGPTIAAVTPYGRSALLLLSRTLDGGIGTTAGSILFTVVASTVFVAVPAAVADITLAAAAGLAHDLAAPALKKGTMAQAAEIRTAQWSAVAVGILGIGLAVSAPGYTVNFLIAFAIAIAASTIFPALVYSLFWPRYNRSGLLWTVAAALRVPSCCRSSRRRFQARRPQCSRTWPSTSSPSRPPDSSRYQPASSWDGQRASVPGTTLQTGKPPWKPRRESCWAIQIRYPVVQPDLEWMRPPA